MKVTKEIIFQRNPGSVSDTIIYTLPADTIVTIDYLVISNTSGADATYRLYHCKPGAVPTRDNALLYNISILANKSHFFPLLVYMFQEGETIYLRPSVAGAIAITAYGTKSIE